MAMIMLTGFIVLIALPSVLWLYALADVIINDFQYFTTKFVWLVVLCFFPPFGTLLYFLIGRNQRRTYYPVGRFVVLCILIVPALMIAVYILYSLGHLTFMPEPPKEILI
ncbi:MAG: PLDc N-terminal domain-containing protein [Desulfuromonadaceae bacterium]|nr:PLDc N-terminal domain-containing protein [Desulfuromonadaceae bacterium]MDD5106843.1 PLDc N-terminal domain-containing protein [Desulfuromonadaceae bacterium]